ncbi:MAG: DUF2157 domain-containing protein [Hyphomicrobiaceae bacterium]|nr:MAG: DUF2157 domain-containing protein [Hyphomicrobiaceae bacterium]
MWYRHRIERDLQRWQSSGWVTEAGAAAIRNDLAARKSPFSAASVFAILGAVLFGFAVMSFVAANWNAMPKIARLLLLLATLWACYGAAAVLIQRQLQAFAHAAVLAGVAVYGASIMLIAQMYHMEGNPPDAVLMWALGAFLATLLVRSNPALAATFVLLVVWTWWERALSEAAHWAFPVAWAAAAAAAAWLRWRPGLHLAALSLVAWLVPLGFFILDHHAHWVVAVVGATAAGAAVLAAPAIDRRMPASAALFSYGLAVAFAGLFILQFVDDAIMFGRQARMSTGMLIVLAILTLALLLGAMLWALASNNRAALWLAYAAFALEIFMLYVKTFGTLLNTSLFFLIAALIVSGLAWAAYALHQRKSNTGAET